MNVSKEYLMLREEILQLGNLESQTINFLYVFVGSVLAFSLTQEDTIAILISCIVIIPAYNIVISYEQGIYKIGAYLSIFLEGSDFNWERRSFLFYDALGKKACFKSPVQVFNYPFLFISILITIFFLVRTDYTQPFDFTQMAKLFLAIILFVYILFKVICNRHYSISKYIGLWREIKDDSTNSNRVLPFDD